ncbi:hypothetical protein JCM5350_006420 [Sporobolomyces pararoseus]
MSFEQQRQWLEAAVYRYRQAIRVSNLEAADAVVQRIAPHVNLILGHLRTITFNGTTWYEYIGGSGRFFKYDAGSGLQELHISESALYEISTSRLPNGTQGTGRKSGADILASLRTNPDWIEQFRLSHAGHSLGHRTAAIYGISRKSFNAGQVGY